jgi:hypothetical protein
MAKGLRLFYDPSIDRLNELIFGERRIPALPSATMTCGKYYGTFANYGGV